MTPVGAQPGIGFESVDADANGQLTRGEFANLPGFYGTGDLFGELDQDANRLVSREEWIKGFPDDRGNRGVAKEAILSGAPRGTPPNLTRHGRSVPRQRNEEIALEALPPTPRDQWPPLTGHGGANGRKRGVAQVPPPQSPDEPPPLLGGARTRR